MANQKQLYRQVAEKLCATMNPLCPPTAKRNMTVSYTRTPAGAWVQVWVWVPRVMAELEKGSKS